MGKQNNSSVKPNWRLASKPSWRLAPKPIGWPPLCIQWTILLLIAQKGGPSHSSSCCPLIFVFFFLWAHIPHPFPIGSVSGTYVTCVWSWSSHLQYPCSAMPLWFKFECVFLHGTLVATPGCTVHVWSFPTCPTPPLFLDLMALLCWFLCGFAVYKPLHQLGPLVTGTLHGRMCLSLLALHHSWQEFGHQPLSRYCSYVRP